METVEMVVSELEKTRVTAEDLKVRLERDLGKCTVWK